MSGANSLELTVKGQESEIRKALDMVENIEDVIYHDSLIQNACDFIVDTIALDAAAAIGQQDSLRIFGQAGQILFHTTLAEIDLRAVLENKVVHNDASFL